MLTTWPKRAVVSVLVLALVCLNFLPTVAQAATIAVPVGTSVALVIPETISPETHTVGQRVILSVAHDVLVQGATVIAAGAGAVGEVSVSRKAGAVGAPGEIGIVLKTVTAIDGTVVPVTGAKVLQGKSKQTESIVVTILCCVLGLLMKGEKVDLEAGSTVTVSVAAEVKVSV